MKNSIEKKEKTLQKLTDFSKIKNLTKLKEYLKNHPEDLEDIVYSLQDRYNNVLLKKSDENDKKVEDMFCYAIEMSRGKEEGLQIRNITYELNHTTISNYINNFILKNNCFPSALSIAEETKLSRQTVYSHINSGLFHQNRALVNKRSDYMINTALERLYLIGVRESNVKALNHFINYSTKGINTTNVNNYIQINNLKITTEEFNSLPPETMIQIEEILSNQTKKLT